MHQVIRARQAKEIAQQWVAETSGHIAADLSDSVRPVAIEGSREMIARGDHREAVFWMVATYSRCQWVLAHDTSEAVQEQHNEVCRQLLADLRIAGFAYMERRGEQVRALLPRVLEVAELIIQANPEIET